MLNMGHDNVWTHMCLEVHGGMLLKGICCHPGERASLYKMCHYSWMLVSSTNDYKHNQIHQLQLGATWTECEQIHSSSVSKMWNCVPLELVPNTLSCDPPTEHSESTLIVLATNELKNKKKLLLTSEYVTSLTFELCCHSCRLRGELIMPCPDLAR